MNDLLTAGREIRPTGERGSGVHGQARECVGELEMR